MVRVGHLPLEPSRTPPGFTSLCPPAVVFSTGYQSEHSLLSWRYPLAQASHTQLRISKKAGPTKKDAGKARVEAARQQGRFYLFDKAGSPSR
jgi:hypothetical protein